MACDKCGVWQHSKCHNIPEDLADSPDYHFFCTSCKRREEEAKQPKLPPLKLRLTSASPGNRDKLQANGAVPTGQTRPLETARIPVQQQQKQPPPPLQSPQRVHANQPVLNGPSLSPRGQALGPPGIQRSEAAYGYNPAMGSSSPAQPRPYTPGQPSGVAVANGYPNSSPPQYRAPTNPFSSYSLPRPQQNGSSFSASNPFSSAHNPPYGSSFNRPVSSAGPSGPYGSPVKHSPAPSPRPPNGVPNAYNFTNSPHSSFPPSSVQRPSFSPTKNPNSSPPPPVAQMSSPAPAPVRIAPSPSQMPAQMLPDPIPAPSKHDGARPVSSHSTSETPVLPPIKSLSPSANPQILSPPTKKPSPTPERHQFAPVSGNGLGGGVQ